MAIHRRKQILAASLIAAPAAPVRPRDKERRVCLVDRMRVSDSSMDQDVEEGCGDADLSEIVYLSSSFRSGKLDDLWLFRFNL